MPYSGINDHDNQTVASLTIDSNLCVGSCNEAWRTAGLPGGDPHHKERIDRLFPGSDVAVHVLDVLASGEAREMVVLSFGAAKEKRYLCASFYPQPRGAKPFKVKRVLMQAWQTKASLLLDSATGAVLEVSPAAETMLGRSSAELTADGWRVETMTEEQFEAALEAAERNGSHYLGRFQHRTPDGRELELESILARVDGYKC